jgi:glucarate dehydratase
MDTGFRIRDVRATTVTVPLEAPLRHSNGAHWGRFVRTLVEVETESGLVGLGELGGGGESAEAAVRMVGRMLIGHDPFRLEELRAKICNPTASLYNNRTQIHAAVEFACLDLIGQHLGVPVCDLIGGRVRDRVQLASYLFFRYPGAGGKIGEVRTPEQLVRHALKLKSRHGFTAHKLKGGVFPYEYELECYEALVDAMPDDTFRYDPNAAYSVFDAVKIARRIRDLPNDYLEDPTFGLGGLRQVRREGIPIATNTVVVDFEQLATNVLDRAADVILLDTTFWGGIRQCQKAAAVCDTFQLGISVHSSGELGIQLATMLHLAASLPTLGFAIDAHYHELTDDVIVGGKLP